MHATLCPAQEVTLTLTLSHDDDQALVFYESLGFVVERDEALDSCRWVEMHPCAGSNGFALITSGLAVGGIQSGIISAAVSVEVLAEQLYSLGSDLAESEGWREPTVVVQHTADGPNFWLTDPLGNVIFAQVGEPTTR